MLTAYAPHPTPFARAVTWGVATSSRWFMEKGQRLEVDGRERLDAARAEARGLLTFSNHVSLFDDPWLTACLTGPSWEALRWIAADADNFFGTRWKATFFGAGKCVPVVRGIGRQQPGMAFLAERLLEGDWVHVFPEGGRSREEAGALQTPLKAGLAQLVQAAAPLTLPFFHVGMHDVLPIGTSWPRFGQEVRMLLGEVTDTAEGLAARPMREITAWAEDCLRELQDALVGAP